MLHVGKQALMMYISLYFVEYEDSTVPPNKTWVDTLGIIMLIIDVIVIVLMLVLIVRMSQNHIKRCGGSENVLVLGCAS